MRFGFNPLCCFCTFVFLLLAPSNFSMTVLTFIHNLVWTHNQALSFLNFLYHFVLHCPLKMLQLYLFNQIGDVNFRDFKCIYLYPMPKKKDPPLHILAQCVLVYLCHYINHLVRHCLAILFQHMTVGINDHQSIYSAFSSILWPFSFNILERFPACLLYDIFHLAFFWLICSACQSSHLIQRGRHHEKRRKGESLPRHPCPFLLYYIFAFIVMILLLLQFLSFLFRSVPTKVSVSSKLRGKD